MCGFLGAVNFERGINFMHPALQKGLAAINHRGPDGSKDLNLGNVYLGNNRLSIIDLSSRADPPLKSVNSDAYIIFNGEIYNYKELKNNLRNTKFQTTSDTEVLLEGYLREGIKYFKKLRGIYAFAIFDNRTEPKIILGRDPSGIKPLYFFNKGSFYIFGSEVKALLPAVRNDLTLNENVLKCFLNLAYCPEPHTIYNEVSAVKPGSIVEITKQGVKKTNLTEFNFETANNFDFCQNVEKVEEHLKVAVERNLIADVEVAVALSGGIDSSLIYYYANQLNSSIKGLTIRFDDEEYNEEQIAKIYSDTLKGNHEFVEVESELNLETLNKILSDFDQPYADSSAINVFYLTKATSKVTKVLLGGDGGDELFNGYPSQTWLTYIEKLSRNAITKKSGDTILSLSKVFTSTSQGRLLKRISDLWNDKPHELLYDWHSWFPRNTIFQNESPFLFDTSTGVDLYESIFENDAPHKFKSYVVFDYFRKQMLSDYLRKTDMMSMLNGVEYRVPILDEDLVSFALTIPFEQKSSLKETKKILRAIHSKKYPLETSKMSKKGFTIPLDSSLSKDDFNIIKENLIKKDNIVNGYIKKSYVEFLFKALDDRIAVDKEISRAGIYQRILMLYSLSLWNDNK
ncbi:MAG: asparagine synthase (glutamine-hydrolyzing) [Bacteroidota bacterium]|nr:asparagine synthase (glutamine-hydrolyzing) [Bacteroidota bacterium]